jgi:hypothetical protein
MAGGELRLGTASIYMTTYITLVSAHQHKNTDLHGYILGGKCELIAQNQALERADKRKFSLRDEDCGGRPSPCHEWQSSL